MLLLIQQMDQLKRLEIAYPFIKKKQEFKGGMLKYTNLKCDNYQDFVYLDSYSKLIKLN